MADIKAPDNMVAYRNSAGTLVNKHNQPVVLAQCPYCGRYFWRAKSAKREAKHHYCSPACNNRARCRGKKPWNYKPEGKVDKGYYFIDGKRVHRLVMEQVLNRELKTEEHVHHISGDKLDNRPENLVVVDNPLHKKIENAMIKKFCEEHFSSDKNNREIFFKLFPEFKEEIERLEQRGL